MQDVEGRGAVLHGRHLLARLIGQLGWRCHAVLEHGLPPFEDISRLGIVGKGRFAFGREGRDAFRKQVDLEVLLAKFLDPVSQVGRIDPVFLELLALVVEVLLGLRRRVKARCGQQALVVMQHVHGAEIGHADQLAIRRGIGRHRAGEHLAHDGVGIRQVVHAPRPAGVVKARGVVLEVVVDVHMHATEDLGLQTGGVAHIRDDMQVNRRAGLRRVVVQVLANGIRLEIPAIELQRAALRQQAAARSAGQRQGSQPGAGRLQELTS